MRKWRVGAGLARHGFLALGLLTGLFSGPPASALEPPRPGELQRYALDGTLARRRAFAEALGNHRFAPGMAAHARARLQALAAGRPESVDTPPSGWRGMPTKGTVKILALLISFSDYPSSNSPADIASQLFGEGIDIGYPYESLHAFYDRSSYGQLNFTGNVLGWYTPAYPRSSVGQTTESRESLIEEALTYYEARGHDFAQYDNDGDGVIDFMVVVWTGPDNGWANFWWGYQTGFVDSSYTLDGKRLGAYSWQWESNPYPGNYDPNVVIHETGHGLGLPDYYDYDDSRGPRGGIGGLDMMDAAWGDHNAFSKFILDWTTPTVQGSGARMHTLRPSSANPDALIVMPGGIGPDGFDEYFMVQSRDRELNDIDYPADGLLVWHLDARIRSTPWGDDFVYDNSYTSHKLIRLMEADGLEQIEQNRWANPGDYYKTGNTFGPDTAPNSNCYAGTGTDLLLDQIDTGSTTATFRASLPGGPDAFPQVQFTNPAPDATVNGVVDLSATATDDQGIFKVVFFVDQAPLAEVRSAPYHCAWDTTSFAPGAHTLKVEATDTAGQTASQEVTVTRSAPPSVAGMAKAGNPFRLVVTGGGFQTGVTARINGEVWGQVVCRSPAKLVLKGGAALKAKVPRATPTVFVFTNPDGGSVTLSWQY